MISETLVLENLRMLEILYTNSPTDRERLFYSKLAILELCGWTEECMDTIIGECKNRKVQDDGIKKYLDDVVTNNWGFDYSRNFRSMLFQVIGAVGVEILEKSVDQIKFQVFCSALATLKTPRRSLAHTHITGTTTTINAPSWTIAQFSHVFEGLKEIEAKLVEMGF